MGRAWTWPSDVVGWLTEREGEALRDLTLGRRVLELGSFQGRSTICMAQFARHVAAVDSHCGDVAIGKQDSLGVLLLNLERYCVWDKVAVLLCTTRQFGAFVGQAKFDAVFVDASHDHVSVVHDVGLALRCTKATCAIALHDWGLPGVKSGAAELGLVAPSAVVDGLAVFRFGR